FWSLQQYISMTGDTETVKHRYLNHLKTIIDGFIVGTDFNIKVQEDGLLAGGKEGMALTWMDVITPEGPVTPRTGCPVEVNALWYNALCFYQSLQPQDYVEALIDKLTISFEENFWEDEMGYLADVVNNGQRDWSIRPNMIIATSLEYSPLNENQKAQVLEVVKSNLLTDRGLRSLAPSDPQYKGYYHGNQAQRDRAYHQGTVWPWLLGHFAESYLKIHRKAGIAFVQKLIKGFDEVMTQYGIGTVAEIYDGDPPHRPKGAISQASSIGELLRMMYIVKKF